MDKFAAKQTQMVVAALLAITLATFGVLLWRVGAGYPVPDLLVNLSTTLLGIVTGSVVSLGAKPRVDAPQRAASDASYETRAAAAIPTLAAAPAAEYDLDEGALVSDEEYLDDAVPAQETDAPDSGT